MTDLEFPKNKIERFIKEIADDPKRFYELGKAHNFLKALFKCNNYDCLKPLLKSENFYTKRIAIWITSELAVAAKSLLKYVIPLLKDDDRYIVFHAYETLMSISDANAYVTRHIPIALTHEDHVIRELGMFLLSNASDEKLRTARQYFSEIENEEHYFGIDLLLNKDTAGLADKIQSNLSQDNFLKTRYLLIAARRSNFSFERTQLDRIESNLDQSLVQFAKAYLISPIQNRS